MIIEIMSCITGDIIAVTVVKNIKVGNPKFSDITVNFAIITINQVLQPTKVKFRTGIVNPGSRGEAIMVNGMYLVMS